MTKKSEYHQQGQTVKGHQINAGGDVKVEHLGDKITYQGLTVTQVATLMLELEHKDQPEVWNGRYPYLGLTAFQESDAQYFFGRESLVDDLLERVQKSRFITIAGPSGSGKSSVARAGLLHALREGRLEKSDNWLLATMQPKGNPVGQLAASIDRMMGKPNAGDYLRENGMGNPLALHEQIEPLLQEDKHHRCVLLVDQFEELFTQTKDDGERVAFIDLLTTAAQADEGRIIILLSLRSDFISHCARYPNLRSLMSQQFQLVGAMDPPDLAKAITLPALEVGAKIDPELVSRIMADMKGEPGALPLMSFALRDLFEAEKSTKGKPMDLLLPEYVERGGIESALERHANEVFDDFTDEQKTLARGVFSKLIEVGQGRADTRRTAALNELIPAGTEQEAVEAVVNTLAKEGVRLITTSGDETAEGGSVTIAHEKLIDAWPWLRQLVDENRDMIILQNQISTDAQAWAQEEDAGYLYRGGRLAQVKEMLAFLKPNLNTISQRFIQASLKAQEAEQRAEEERIQKEEALKQEQANASRFRRLTRWLSMAAAVAVIATIVALFFLNTARQESTVADEARATAEVGATKESQARNEAVEARGTSDLNAGLASIRETEANVARATSEFNAELAVTNEANAVLAQGAAQVEAIRAANAEATAVVAQSTAQADAIYAANAESTAVAAQAKSDTNAVQAINLAQIRLADSEHLANTLATVDDALANQEAFFASNEIYQTQYNDVQLIRNSLNTVFAQNLQIGLNINPNVGLNPDVDEYEDVLGGLNWVRFSVYMSREQRDIEATINYYEPIVEAYALRGISILFIINQDTLWGNAPWDNDNDDAWAVYADNLAEEASSLTQAMSQRYAKYGALIAYEVWNEPDAEWSNSSGIGMPPEKYAIVLERTANAIRSASPDAKIIFGSLSTGSEEGISYVQIVQAELGGDLPVDAIGLHPYGSWATVAPFNFAEFETLNVVFDAYQEAFPDIPLWITEIGVPSYSEQIGSEYYPVIADYLLDIYQYIGLNYARQVPVVIWFAWSDQFLNAGIVDVNGNPKEFIYDAFADVRSRAIFDEPIE